MSNDSLPKKTNWLSRAIWLGSDHSAVNVNRFWVYLAGIGLTLCAVCLVRAIETAGHR